MSSTAAAQAQIASIMGKAGSGKKGGKGKKGRKIGRSKRHPAAQRYLAEKRWEKNKLKKVRRHVQRFPEDMQAERALVRLSSR